MKLNEQETTDNIRIEKHKNEVMNKGEGRIRTAVYRRMNTDDTGAGKLNEMEERFFKKNKDLLLFGIYTDEGVSGTTDPKTRPGFSAMYQEIMKGNVDFVVTDSFSTLVRNIEHMIRIVRELGEKGVQVYFIKEKKGTEFRIIRDLREL